MNPGGHIEFRDDPGFYAIGTGCMLALGSLYGTYGQNLRTPEVIYRACEAKFLGEIALGVGRTTTIAVFRPDLSHRFIDVPEELERLRRFYEEQRPPIPPAAMSLIRDALSREKKPK